MTLLNLSEKKENSIKQQLLHPVRTHVYAIQNQIFSKKFRGT